MGTRRRRRRRTTSTNRREEVAPFGLPRARSLLRREDRDLPSLPMQMCVPCLPWYPAISFFRVLKNSLFRSQTETLFNLLRFFYVDVIINSNSFLPYLDP